MKSGMSEGDLGADSHVLLIARVTLGKWRFTRCAVRTSLFDWVCHGVPDTQQQQANKEVELEMASLMKSSFIPCLYVLLSYVTVYQAIKR